MITVEKLAPAWRQAYLVSRNSVFTPIDTEYFDRTEKPASAFPIRTFIGRDESKVVSWGSFFLRQIESGRRNAPILKIASACAIGTLPDYQRKGLGRKVWQAAEESLVQEADGIVIYTGEGGQGYPFYRSLGFLPLFYPRALRLTVSAQAHQADAPGVKTKSFTQSQALSHCRDEVFTKCYRGYGGFLAYRPWSLDQWAEASFFYDPNSVGCTPQISWLEDAASGRWLAYVIWAGPIEKVGWKKGVVELWELACDKDCDPTFLRDLLQPACAAAFDGSGQLDWWAVPGHGLTEQMLALGFVEKTRSLCVLGKVFDPARMLSEHLGTKCTNGAGHRVEFRLNDCDMEIEYDAATRIIFGRSSASLEHQQGMLTMRPLEKTERTLEILDRALPVVPWSYFASEFI